MHCYRRIFAQLGEQPRRNFVLIFLGISSWYQLGGLPGSQPIFSFLLRKSLRSRRCWPQWLDPCQASQEIKLGCHLLPGTVLDPNPVGIWGLNQWTKDLHWCLSLWIKKIKHYFKEKLTVIEQGHLPALLCLGKNLIKVLQFLPYVVNCLLTPQGLWIQSSRKYHFSTKHQSEMSVAQF